MHINQYIMVFKGTTFSFAEKKWQYCQKNDVRSPFLREKTVSLQRKSGNIAKKMT